jgi:hypothetical protein
VCASFSEILGVAVIAYREQKLSACLCYFRAPLHAPIIRSVNYTCSICNHCRQQCNAKLFAISVGINIYDQETRCITLLLAKLQHALPPMVNVEYTTVLPHKSVHKGGLTVEGCI